MERSTRQRKVSLLLALGYFHGHSPQDHLNSPGISLAGRELPLDNQRGILSFLPLTEMVRLMTQSKGWQTAALCALEQSPNVGELTTRQQYDFALRHCKRLQHISTSLDPVPLMQATAGTLRTVELDKVYGTVPLVPGCRNLTALNAKNTRPNAAQTQQVVDTYPALQELKVAFVHLATLLSSGLPLRSVHTSGSALEVAHFSLLPAHSGLEELSFAVDPEATPADYLSLFLTFQRLPRLRKLSLRCANDHSPPSQPTAPIVLSELEELSVNGSPFEVDPRAPLPAFSAPRLRSLSLSLKAAALSNASTIALFPALTSCWQHTDLFATSEGRARAVEQLQRKGAWRELSRLMVAKVGTLSSVAILAHQPAPSLRELTVSCNYISSESLRALLFRQPLLEALRIAGWPFQNTASLAAAAGSVSGIVTPASFAHPTLRRLSLCRGEPWGDQRNCSLALEGVSFPNLQDLEMSELGAFGNSAWNIAPLLLRCPALTSLFLEKCGMISIRLPAVATLPELPKIQHVEIVGCQLITEKDVLPLAAPGASVYVGQAEDSEDYDSEYEG